MTAWLKVIGTSTAPLRDDWLNHAPSLRTRASFAKPPGRGSFLAGDEIVYYALRGDLSRVVAAGRVIGHAYEDSRVDRGWPWLVPIQLELVRDRISGGIALDALEVDRVLRKSVQRRSHIRLHDAEVRRARNALAGR